MPWHGLTHRETGETTIVADLDGIDPEKWDCTELARAPNDDEVFLEGELQIDPRLTKLIADSLLVRIEAEAGAFRSRFITVSPGKEMTYVRKEMDARDCLAGGAGPWPMLAQEAAARGIEVEALAAAIVAKAGEWQMIGGAIEATTVAAKMAVEAAQTAEAKRAAAAIDWEGLFEAPQPAPPPPPPPPPPPSSE